MTRGGVLEERGWWERGWWEDGTNTSGLFFHVNR